MYCLILNNCQLPDIDWRAFDVAQLEPAIDNDGSPIFLATKSSIIIDDPRFGADQIPYGNGVYFQNITRKDLIAYKPDRF